MREKSSKVMVLCDTEEEYAQLMTEFMKKRKNLPWELHTYTDVQDLISMEKQEMEMLVVSESDYGPELQALCPKRFVILNESGVMKWENLFYVDKYQEAEEIVKQLLGIYMEIADVQLP